MYKLGCLIYTLALQVASTANQRLSCLVSGVENKLIFNESCYNQVQLKVIFMLFPFILTATLKEQDKNVIKSWLDGKVLDTDPALIESPNL